MQGDDALKSPGDLSKHTLLHDTDRAFWTEWLELAGATNVDPSRGTVVDDTNVLIQAAIDGLGVALGSTLFVADRLASGKLVKPFEATLHSDFAYYIVCPKQHLKRAEVTQFKSWLMQQTQ